MDFMKLMQTAAAVGTLVQMVKAFKKDGTISKEEWGAIIAHGVVPILKVHGVTVDLPPIDKGGDIGLAVAGAIAALQVAAGK
jgi:hypothetical protein